jgi:hypothetical protein
MRSMSFVLFFVATMAFSEMPSSPPEPAPAGKVSFEQLNQEWSLGNKVSADDLVGTWFKVTDTFAPGCGGPGVNSFDKYMSGRDAKQLIFTSKSVEKWPPNSGTRTAVEVIIKYGEALSQGPYVASNDEPQISEWYIQPTAHKLQVAHDIYSEQSCRMLAPSNFLVCAAHVKVDHCKRCAAQFRVCAEQQVGVFEVYRK